MNGSTTRHCSIPHSGWLTDRLADCPLGPAPGLPQCWGNSTHTHTLTQRLPCLLKPSPAQSRLAQHSLRARAVRQAVKGACWGTDCRPPLSPWEAHCGCWSSQDLGNSLLPVCLPEVVNCPSSPHHQPLCPTGDDSITTTTAHRLLHPHLHLRLRSTHE